MGAWSHRRARVSLGSPRPGREFTSGAESELSPDCDRTDTSVWRFQIPAGDRGRKCAITVFY